MSEVAVTPQERAAIIDAYNAYAEGVDTKNWPQVRACFADEVILDYGEVNPAAGDPDEPRKADDWVPVIQGVINGFDVTRHVITNHRFSRDGQRIVCRGYLMADHVIFADPEGDGTIGADEVVTVVGEYTNTYENIAGQWKICKSRLSMDYSTGNQELFVVAIGRAAAG